MDVILITITLISVATAIGFATLAWQARRDERARADARVALLAEAIDGPSPAADHAGSPALFAPEHHSAAHGNPFIKAAVGIAMTLALVIGVAMATHDTPAPNAAAAARPETPLELLSMRHSREAGKLTVTGLVRNPGTSRDMYGVTAVVYAFGRDGALVASNRAPLDATMLRPGEESSFVVNIPGSDAVERYRVTFRTDRGVIRHLDRRSATRLAAAAPVRAQ